MDWWNDVMNGEGTGLLFVQVFIVVFSALLLDLIQKRIAKRLATRAQQTATLWDDALLYAAQPPVSVLIWVLGIGFAAEIVGRETEAVIFEAVDPARDVATVSIVTWFFMRLIAAGEQNLIRGRQAEHRPVDLTTVDAVGKLLRISVIITAFLVGLQTLGFSISGILAFGGVGGIAVGFAAKDLLANFFGGFMIYLDRPFAVGDWVRSPDRDIEGTVEKIGWRLTCIRTFDKRPLYIPNATFASIAVENPSRMSHRRIYETIGIRYDDAEKMAPIVTDVKAMLLVHPAIDDTQTLIVAFDRFAPSSLDFFIYTFTRTTVWAEFHEVKQDILLRTVEIVTAHGAEIAFPTSTIHFADPPRQASSVGAQDRLDSRVQKDPA